MARWIFEANEHELVDLAFTGVTWPRLEIVVQRQMKLGMTQICIVPVYLFTGVLIERIKAQIERLKQQYPQIAFALGTHFGFDKGIFDLLDSKVAGRELPAGSLLECDGCKYREAAEAEHLHDHSHTATGAPGHQYIYLSGQSRLPGRTRRPRRILLAARRCGSTRLRCRLATRRLPRIACRSTGQ